MLIDLLHSVLSESTWSKYHHLTPLLCNLHWQQIPERMAYRLAVLAFRCQHGIAPPYLYDYWLYTSRDSCGSRSYRTRLHVAWRQISRGVVARGLGSPQTSMTIRESAIQKRRELAVQFSYYHRVLAYYLPWSLLYTSWLRVHVSVASIGCSSASIMYCNYAIP